MEVAEEKLIKAKSKVQDCVDCEAHCLKREGIYLLYSEQTQEAIGAYSQSIKLFNQVDNTLEQAKGLMARGLPKE